MNGWRAAAGGLALGLAAGWNIANTGAAAGPLSRAYDVPLATIGLSPALAAGIPFAAVFAGAQRLRPDAPAAAIGLVNSAATLAILAGTPLVGLTFDLPGDGRIGFATVAVAWAAALPAARRATAALTAAAAAR